jgi:serine/threonine protein kinase/Tol biopolymer transport system component
LTQGPDIDPGKWPDISRVFAAAAALEGPSRQAYVESACRHDPGLRAAVESLLNAHNAAGSFGAMPLFASSAAVKRLSPGSQLGPFRIESLLGAGGMGEVYRAHDTKLHRAVAIKVLPDFFAQHPDRLARFEEEARALAALNHPHIGAIYGVEESAGVAALVLELVEGPTLAERLAVGPLRFDEVVWIARQLAEGLEAAHERGIVHRDLKPANIKITPDGNVKILDFGLAKTAGSPLVPALPPSTTSPRDATQFGMVLGTVGYMSPEQARGEPVDKRTDIWAFGCVLFEMCAHQPPFAGATISDAQAAVIEREPDWELLRAGTPANLVRLLRRCLTKDPKLRLRDIGEARIALERDTDTADLAPRSERRRVAAVAAILATATSFAIAFAIFGWPRSRPSVSPSPIRFAVPPPEGTRFIVHPGRTFFVLSPDGSQLAFVARPASGSTGRRRVWVRAVADVDARPLPGTDGAASIFWSPDSRSLAFVADGKLKRIDLPGGAAVTICDAPSGEFTRGTWGAHGVILIDDIGKAIHSVPARAGASPQTILTANRSNREVRVNWPWFLPDGKRFLYTVRLDDGEGELRLAQLRLDYDKGELRSVQVEGGPRKVLSASSNAQWIDPNVVVFAHEGVLMGQRVDVEAARPLGEPFPIAERVDYFFTTSRAMFSASSTGTVAYHEGGELSQLVWADRHGNEVGTIGGLADYEQNNSARLSRDSTMLLTARARPGLGTYDIWRRDLDRGIENQLTVTRGSEITPVWVDGERAIVYASDSPGFLPHLFRKDLATGTEEQLLAGGPHQVVSDVFPDGRSVAYSERGELQGFKLFQLPLARGASPKRLLPGRNVEGMRLSPDGRAMAFGGRNQGTLGVYVAPLPVTSEPLLVVEGITGQPRWSPDGRQIYYVSSDDAMMTLAVKTVPSLSVDKPKQLFKLRRPARLQDVSRDGRFLLLVHQVRAGDRPIVVVTAAIRSTQR